MKFLFIILLIAPLAVAAQQPDNSDELIAKGNTFYQQQQYAQAEAVYSQVLEIDPGNMTARFNRANAWYKQSKADEAAREFDDIAFKAEKAGIKSKAYYNEGVIFS